MVNWFFNPTKKIVIISLIIWLAGITMLFFATNFFREINFITSLLVTSSFFAIVRVYMNYKKIND